MQVLSTAFMIDQKDELFAKILLVYPKRRFHHGFRMHCKLCNSLALTDFQPDDKEYNPLFTVKPSEVYPSRLHQLIYYLNIEPTSRFKSTVNGFNVKKNSIKC